MSNADAAKQALYAEIERQVKAIEASRHVNTITEAAVLKDLALSFRLVAGGPQPGGSVVSN